MGFDAEHLKRELLLQSDLSVLWNAFMNAAGTPEFREDGFPCKDRKLHKELEDLAKVITKQVEVRFRRLDLYEAIPGELYHGPLHVNTGLGNVFYFKSVNAGLFAVPTGRPSPQGTVTYARFSVDWKIKGLSDKVQ